jgi:phosphoglycolate phosphatase
MKPEVLIWDWNGTLLNDVGICVEAINILLRERGLAEVTVSRYKEVFTFPVRDYYEAIGFDFTFEQFDGPALAFMDLYIERVYSAKLHPQAIEVLMKLRDKGIRQMVLSAMEQGLLDRLFHHFGLTEYFEAIFGIEDHFGGGKTHRGIQLMEQLGVDPAKCLFVGDTLHDQEVAESMGCRNILVSIGHQSAGRLRQNGNDVIDNLKDVLSFFTH